MLQKIKETIFRLVQWAEKEMIGKSGKEKRAAVVTKACELTDWPYIPDWIEVMFEPVLYGWLVDGACNLWNILFGHAFTSADLTPEQTAKAAELISVTPVGESLLPKEQDLPIKVAALIAEAPTVDDKLSALYAQYSVKKD
jgi:hypothetical protein